MTWESKPTHRGKMNFLLDQTEYIHTFHFGLRPNNSDWFPKSRVDPIIISYICLRYVISFLCIYIFGWTVLLNQKEFINDACENKYTKPTLDFITKYYSHEQQLRLQVICEILCHENDPFLNRSHLYVHWKYSRWGAEGLLKLVFYRIISSTYDF